MLADKKLVIYFFRYLFLALAMALVLFILSRAIFTARTLSYNLDFNSALSQDIVGWYPESRVELVASSTQSALHILAEPIYLKIYSPVDFQTLTISGAVDKNNKDINIGLRQKDGSWFFQPITNNNFRLDFDLSQAQIKRNQLEIILAIPQLGKDSGVSLVNNWTITLNR